MATPTTEEGWELAAWSLKIHFAQVERDRCIKMAVKAFGLDKKFVNFYECDICGVAWTMKWSCACDDKCPSCGDAMRPYDGKVEGEEE